MEVNKLVFEFRVSTTRRIPRQFYLFIGFDDNNKKLCLKTITKIDKIL